MSGVFLDAGLLVACHIGPAPYLNRKALCDVQLCASRHVVFSGRYQIANIVDIKGTPNVPVQRRVLLLDVRSHLVIAETWSNVSGRYTFDCLAPGKYDVIAYDHTGNYRAVIADGIDAVPMP